MEERRDSNESHRFSRVASLLNEASQLINSQIHESSSQRSENNAPTAAKESSNPLKGSLKRGHE